MGEKRKTYDKHTLEQKKNQLESLNVGRGQKRQDQAFKTRLVNYHKTLCVKNNVF